jgi:hypothetical protein
MSDLYNNKKSIQSNLLKDLKALPKINAPENFEFNLMTRIQNKNFGLVEDKRPKFNFIKFFAPSAAVAAVIILFFVFYPQGEQIQQQLAVQKTIGDSQSVVNNSIDKAKEFVENIPNGSISGQHSVQKSTPFASPSTANQNKILIPISSQRSVSVDDYISGEKTNANRLLGGSTVNSGDKPYSGGFLIEKKTDRETLEKYRDSLKRAQQIADSLKKASK